MILSGIEGSKWNLYEYVGGSPETYVDPSGNNTVVAGATVIISGISLGFCLAWVAGHESKCAKKNKAVQESEPPKCECGKTPEIKYENQFAYCLVISWSGPCGGQWVCR